MYITGDNHARTVTDKAYETAFQTIVHFVKKINSGQAAKETFPLFLMGSSVFHYLKSQASSSDFDYGISRMPVTQVLKNVELKANEKDASADQSFLKDPTTDMSETLRLMGRGSYFNKQSQGLNMLMFERHG